MTDTLTLVIVTIVNADGETESSSGTWDPSADAEIYGTLESVIAETKEAAADRFNEQEYRGLEARTIVNVITMPKPKLVATTVAAELPEQAEDGSGSTVTSTIS